ncbi:MFS transporter [Granulicella cerasi]|uniref:MFS transporter n=2 Tax=Granulicella cerasi TaxID=741063 RepID=A0ABW1Z901_9BACT
MVAWQYGEFRSLALARFIGTTGAEAQAVAVAWHVYQLTHSALALGYTGLALFLPGMLFVLPAGHVSDLFDRRRVLLICYLAQILASAGLLWLTLRGVSSVWPVYGFLFLIGTGRSFAGPAQQSLLPLLVPKEHFLNAVTWNASIFKTANMLGPMVGGILFTLPLARWIPAIGRLQGAPIVYCVALAAFVLFMVCISFVHPREAAEKRGFSLDSALDGLRYVLSTRLLLGSISLDLFAVLFGGATSLLPIYAEQVLHGQATTLGLLRAMPSLGALGMSLYLSMRPLQRQAGKKMLWSVTIFALATIIFGISRSIPLSCCALFLLGAFDMVSMVVRGSILQLATPAEMRGRVSAVNMLFLGASNELGEYESGLTAHWWGAVRAVIFGGIASLSIVGLWAVFFPALRSVDRLTADDLKRAEEQFATTEPIN